MLMKVVSLLSAAPTQNVCTPVSCTETSVYLNSTTANRRDPPYACRGEKLVFHCEVVNGAGIQWASEPDISCKEPLTLQHIIVMVTIKKDFSINPIWFLLHEILPAQTLPQTLLSLHLHL